MDGEICYTPSPPSSVQSPILPPRLCCAFLFLVSALWFNSRKLLLVGGQEEAIAEMAAEYLHILFPGLCCFMVTQCLQWGFQVGRDHRFDDFLLEISCFEHQEIEKMVWGKD